MRAKIPPNWDLKAYTSITDNHECLYLKSPAELTQIMVSLLKVTYLSEVTRDGLLYPSGGNPRKIGICPASYFTGVWLKEIL
jgi:hypothetical protein